MSQYYKPTLEEIRKAVNEFVDFVKPTYGPAGNKVIITDSNQLVVLDDGAAIADEFHLEDKFMDAIVSLVKGVTKSVNRKLGDGNTGSLIFLKELLSKEENKKTLMAAYEEVREQIKSHIIKIETQAQLEDVALMAYNNPKVAEMVAEIVFKLGPEGSISLEDTNSSETTYEIVEGLQFDKGFISPYLATDEELGVAKMENVPILITEKKIEYVSELNDIASYYIKAGINQLVVVAADFSNDVVEAFVENKRSGKFHVLAIKAPSFGEKRRKILEKISKITGSDLVGQEIRKFELSHTTGKVRNITSTIDQTTIKQANVQEGKDYGIGIIKVGGATKEEMTARSYKINNAINSAKLAMRDGVIPGGGQTLLKIKTSSEAMNAALRAPYDVLIENEEELTEVYDAVEVTLGSLACAVSIAILLRETKGIIVK